MNHLVYRAMSRQELLPAGRCTTLRPTRARPEVAKKSPRRPTTALDQATLLSTVDQSRLAPNLLARLSASTRSEVLRLGRRREYRTGDLLFRQGDSHDGIFLIESGVVKSFYVSEDGKALTLGYWTAGHYVGAPQMFGGGEHAWTSIAAAPTVCLWLPGAELRKLCERCNDLTLALIDVLVHKTQCYCAVLQLLATHSMRVRLARLLVMLSAANHERTVRLSHGELASMIGSTRQWVSLCLAHLQEEGLVTGSRAGAFKVADPSALLKVR